MKHVGGAWAFALLLSVTGCSSRSQEGGGMPVADPAKQSVAEHDIAADLWLRRNQPRTALEHALKAVDLDEDNAEALHLVALDRKSTRLNSSHPSKSRMPSSA